MPPTLKRPAFYVWIAPPDVDVDQVDDDDLVLEHVVIHHADQLRAELEAAKQGLAKGATGAPMHLTSLWIWSALVRTDRFAGKFQDFKVRAVGYEPDRDRDQPHVDDDAAPDDLDAVPTEVSTG